MLRELVDIDWDDTTESVPAVITAVMMPFTYSIANGLAFGVTAYAALQLVTGSARRRDWLMYILAALFIARFIWLAKG